ncbi:hypothetical protein BGZ60DRAFT_417710 [Tricladium varicosporioides]|nr:hypothetical protein BGZ60DRAFT_417710 [Hymenoscyphus varicosporioides]
MSSYAGPGSKRKGKGKAKASADSSRLPTAWSEWEWNLPTECFRRYRLAGTGEYEYQYDYQDENESVLAPRIIPRSVGTSSYIPDQNNDYSSTQDRPPREHSFPVPGSAYSHSSYAPSSRKETGQTFDSFTAFQDIDTVTNQMGASSISGTYSTHSTRIESKNPYTPREKLDPSFKVHPQRDFQVGTVFKILWSEPAGGDGLDHTEVTDNESYTKFGEKTHSKIRRLVVVKSNHGHSLCVPVLTYQGQGVNKKGIRKEGHAALYSSTDKPSFAPGEVLHIKPISVQMSSPKEKLDPMTRINFNKVYTVEHNVKIFIIGKIHPDHKQQFYDAWAESMGFMPSSSTATPSPYFPPSNTTPSFQMPTGGYTSEMPTTPYSSPNLTGYGTASSSYYNSPQSQPQATYGFGYPSSYGLPNPSSNTLGPTYQSNDHMTQESPQSSSSTDYSYSPNYYQYNPYR